MLVPVSSFSFWKQNSLDQNDISWNCCFYLRFFQNQRIGSGNPSISELIRRLLYFKFLVRLKLRMPWNKRQFPCNFILNTSFAHTPIKRRIIIIMNLLVILASTHITCIRCHKNLRFYLTCTNYYSFYYYQWTYLLGT